jgi:hypothetical protein
MFLKVPFFANEMEIQNKKKRCHSYNLQYPHTTIYYINPELLEFHDIVVSNQYFSDNLYY